MNIFFCLKFCLRQMRSLHVVGLVCLARVTWGGSKEELDWFVPAENLPLEILSVIPYNEIKFMSLNNNNLRLLRPQKDSQL